MSQTNEDKLEEQPLPENSKCPGCGGKPTEDSIIHHRLSATGYLHDDMEMECRDCGDEWVLGVPIGSSDEFEDELWCNSCDDSYYLVHRVVPREVGSGFPMRLCLHLKCPNCYNFTKKFRDSDENGVTLIGYPQITGELNDDDPVGYEPDPDVECGEPACIEHGNGTVPCPGVE